jgi:hypothetical protein
MCEEEKVKEEEERKERGKKKKWERMNKASDPRLALGAKYITRKRICMSRRGTLH